MSTAPDSSTSSDHPHLLLPPFVLRLITSFPIAALLDVALLFLRLELLLIQKALQLTAILLFARIWPVLDLPQFT
jgi:hypothetical protein